jgi:hypothetical protein
VNTVAFLLFAYFLIWLQRGDACAHTAHVMDESRTAKQHYRLCFSQSAGIERRYEPSSCLTETQQ